MQCLVWEVPLREVKLLKHSDFEYFRCLYHLQIQQTYFINHTINCMAGNVKVKKQERSKLRIKSCCSWNILTETN